MGVPTLSKKEAFVSRMAQRGNDAASSTGVPIEPIQEEFASHMAQKLNDAATRDAPSVHKREEFVSRMELRWHVNDALSRDVTMVLL